MKKNKLTPPYGPDNTPEGRLHAKLDRQIELLERIVKLLTSNGRGKK